VIGENHFLRSIRGSINSFFVRFCWKKSKNCSRRGGRLPPASSPKCATDARGFPWQRAKKGKTRRNNELLYFNIFHHIFILILNVVNIFILIFNHLFIIIAL
jgi:hypothetical protein